MSASRIYKKITKHFEIVEGIKQELQVLEGELAKYNQKLDDADLKIDDIEGTQILVERERMLSIHTNDKAILQKCRRVKPKLAKHLSEAFEAYKKIYEKYSDIYDRIGRLETKRTRSQRKITLMFCMLAEMKWSCESNKEHDEQCSPEKGTGTADVEVAMTGAHSGAGTKEGDTTMVSVDVEMTDDN